VQAHPQRRFGNAQRRCRFRATFAFEIKQHQTFSVRGGQFRERLPQCLRRAERTGFVG
jgi:hypothetical protein